MGLSRHQRRKGFEVRDRDGCKNRSVGRSLDGFGTVEDGGFKKATVEVNVSRLICESREEAQRGATLLVVISSGACGRRRLAGGREICLARDGETGSTGSSASIQMIVGCC